MGTRLSKAYLLTKVLTASNHEVIVYLYEGAISYLHRAVEAHKNGDHPEAAVAVDRVVSILIELSGNLDYTHDGHLAIRLDSIYNHLIETLTLAASNRDPEALESCESILLILHDAWSQAAASADEHLTHRPERQVWISA